MTTKRQLHISISLQKDTTQLQTILLRMQNNHKETLNYHKETTWLQSTTHLQRYIETHHKYKGTQQWPQKHKTNWGNVANDQWDFNEMQNDHKETQNVKNKESKQLQWDTKQPQRDTERLHRETKQPCGIFYSHFVSLSIWVSWSYARGVGGLFHVCARGPIVS